MEQEDYQTGGVCDYHITGDIYRAHVFPTQELVVTTN